MTYYCQRYSGYAFAPGAQPQYLPDVDFKTVRVKIVLDIDPYNQVVDATCFTDLKSLSNSARNITFHARLMKIKGVRLDNGKKLKYLYDKKKIEIVLPRAVPVEKQITVAIDYRLEKPEIGLHFIKPDKNYPNRPYQVWTQGQPDDSRFWFPCLDVPFTKAVTETVMTVPDEFMAVSNGKLIEMKHDQQKKRRTFHWRMSVKHSLYLVCLAVGKFSEIKHGAYKGIPILYYCEKGREQDAMRGFGKTPDVIRFFSEKTGVDYPYEKYAQIAACEFGGGMENTSATIQTDVALIDKRAAREVDFDGLVAHEAAHQWFGDLVTCKDWSHAWLNESFATYFDTLFMLHDKGKDEFNFKMHAYALAYFAEERERYKRPIVTNVYNYPSGLFDRHLYQKGACVLHFFRYLLGDELWWKSIKYYLNKHRCEAVESQDLVRAVLESTGKNLQPYFDQWIYKAGHPEFKITYDWDAKKKEAHLWVLQKQPVTADVPLFKFPVEFLFMTNGKTEIFTERIEKREHKFVFKLTDEPKMVIFDPNHWLPLKKVDFIKPHKLWANQLRLAENVMARVEAVHAISAWGSMEALDLLKAAFKREKFWGIQQEIARAVANLRSEGAMETLIGFLGVKNPKSRRAVVEALEGFKSRRVAVALSKLIGKDPSYLVQSQAAAVVGRCRTPQSSSILKRAMKEDSWNEVIRQGAVRGFAALCNGELLPQMKKFAACGNPYPIRIAALSELYQHGKGNTLVRDFFISLYQDPDKRIRNESIYALGQLGDPVAVKHLEKIKEESPHESTQRLADEAIRKIRLDIVEK